MAVGRKLPSPRSDLEANNSQGIAQIRMVFDHQCELLTAYGYRPSHAIDGVAALEMLAKNELPDLILLDLMLPRLDGWGFRKAQLANQRLKDIPVVVLSAVGEIVEPIKADHLLRKPVTPETLLASIERFRRRRPA